MKSLSPTSNKTLLKNTPSNCFAINFFKDFQLSHENIAGNKRQWSRKSFKGHERESLATLKYIFQMKAVSPIFRSLENEEKTKRVKNERESDGGTTRKNCGSTFQTLTYKNKREGKKEKKMYVVKNSRWRLSDKSTEISHNFLVVSLALRVLSQLPRNLVISLLYYEVILLPEWGRRRRWKPVKYWIYHWTWLEVLWKWNFALSWTYAKHLPGFSEVRCAFVPRKELCVCQTIHWVFVILDSS